MNDLKSINDIQFFLEYCLYSINASLWDGLRSSGKPAMFAIGSASVPAVV